MFFAILFFMYLVWTFDVKPKTARRGVQFAKEQAVRSKQGPEGASDPPPQEFSVDLSLC